MNALKGQRGIGHPRSTRRKLIEVHEMLHLQPWSHFPLTLSYTSEGATQRVHLLLVPLV